MAAGWSPGLSRDSVHCSCDARVRLRTQLSLRCPPASPCRLHPPARPSQTLHLHRALRHNLYRGAFEGSTHYAREGHRMAAGLAQVRWGRGGLLAGRWNGVGGDG